MRPLLLLASFLLAVPAWATGERVLVSEGNPLKDSVCVSMECISSGARDATVTAKTVSGTMEFTVTGAGGEVKLVHRAELNSNGQVSSTELMRATALVVSAIEGHDGAEAKEAKPTHAAKAKTKHLKKSRLLARR